MQRVRISSSHKLEDSQVRCYNNNNNNINIDGYESLISGLPDDVALNCLLRLPVECHTAGKRVCRRWCDLFGNKSCFYKKRKEMGFNDPWLFVLCYDNNGKSEYWYVLDVINYCWHMIPSMENVCGNGFRCVVVDGGLVVCGGVAVDGDCPVNSVWRFDLVLDSWREMKRMGNPRRVFAGGVIGGKVYVAGGSGGDRLELDSGEVMDPSDGVWAPIANMGSGMACYDSAVLDGKLYVTEGWSWPFYFVPRGQVYDPETNTWECMAMGLREGWTGSSVVLFGRLFVVSEHERTKLKVYDSCNDTWETVDGSPLPEQICKPFVVNGCNDRIYVIGRNICVAVGFIHLLNKNNSTNGKMDFTVQWQVVKGPNGHPDLTPSSAQILYA